MVEMVHSCVRFTITTNHVIYGAILSAARGSGSAAVSFFSEVWGKAPAEIKFDAF